MGSNRARELREWIKTQEPRFRQGDTFGPALWQLTGGTEGGRTTLDSLANATGLSMQEMRALVLIYNLEGYLVHRDNDEIELTERGALWLIMGS
ncbi:MAG: hypothetical protein M3008_00460 [Chloroflexota bacterium]|nr:hypothetical protein [Chloroflexota bacterium]